MPGYALTSGPSQPEFSSFTPVGVSNMVNEFTGDFMYNIPLLEVPGPHGSSYPITLTYNSGIRPEDEASWVGLGWSLNTGAITRQKRGFADDMKAADVSLYNKVPKNWTVTAGSSAGGLEAFGFDTDIVALNVSTALRYNNYAGFGLNQGFGVSLGKGALSLGFNRDNGRNTSFSYSVNPALFFIKSDPTDAQRRAAFDLTLADALRIKDKGKANFIEQLSNRMAGMGSAYGAYTAGMASRPSNVAAYTGASYNFSVGIEADPLAVPVGTTVNGFGSYTYQEGENLDDLKAYGYLYAGNNIDPDERRLSDYGLEKDNPYNGTDIMVGMPFNHADLFFVAAEGISGGFRLFHQNIGDFSPHAVENKTPIYNIGGEIRVIGTIGPGADVGMGFQKISQGAWENVNTTTFPEINPEDFNNKVFMRFSGDLGGAWDAPYQDDELAGADLIGAAAVDRMPNLLMNGGDRPGQSSFIDFRTNEQIYEANADPAKKYNAHTLLPVYNKLANRLGTPSDAFKDLIGEIAITNEAGNQYVFGLPVYNDKEANLSYPIQKASPQDIENNYLARVTDTRYKVGEEVKAPYAGAYLLTEIRTPDYIDTELNGPTKNDLGGYTRFNYKKLYGHTNMYRWRAPYTKALYQRNALGDPKDDAAQVSLGEKEIYYLQAVATKSHVAIFRTSVRQDGLEAALNAEALQGNGIGQKTLHRLDKVELYPLNSVDFANDVYTPKPGLKPIKTVNFDYEENGLAPGIPNSTNPATGKLTLKRVYFEYNGIEKSYITPYTFEYTYPKTSNYPAKYNAIASEIGQLAALEQNPVYSPFAIDGWGNYQTNGEERFRKMQKWVNQVPQPDFDPAAWHLKVIHLPTGGQLHVQYEQDDYAYVQDQPAHVMASLAGAVAENRFTLDCSSIGLSSEEVKDLQKMLTDRYVTNKKKLYFKFLYSLHGDHTPVIEDCNVDYISGYANVASIKENGPNLDIILDTTDKMPKEICQDFVMAQRIGKLPANGSCDPEKVGIKDSNSPAELVSQLINLVRSVTTGMVNAQPNLCKQLNPELSYFRVPMPGNKKGGGLRVKRLLTYDKQPDRPAKLYGYTYHYKKYDDELGKWRSSGVATNEPATFREENILVDFIPRKSQSWFSRTIAGEDKEVSEGPIGETVLPGPSVGYAQVLVQNIHTGATNEGFSVKEFYTAREYPVIAEKSDLTVNKTAGFPVSLGFVNYFIDKVYATQGFNIILNAMHGQPRRAASYQGLLNPDGSLPQDASLVTEQLSHYYEPGDAIPIADEFGGVSMELPGKEVDITRANKSVKEVSDDLNLEVDFSLGMSWPLPLPWFNAVPFFSHTEAEFNVHATTKVVRYPAILKKVENFQEGIRHTEEYLAFDKASGKPVAVKSYDEFEGTYIAYNHPASWEYKNLNQKALYQNLHFKEGTDFYASDLQLGSATIRQQTYTLLGFGQAADCDMLDSYVRGDLLNIVQSGGATSLHHIDSIDYALNELYLTPSRLSANILSSNNISEITVLKSGRTNQLSVDAGTTIFHNVNNATSLPEIEPTEKWVSSSFSDDLKAEIIKGDNRRQIYLNSIYDNMNVAGLLAGVPLPCEINTGDARIKDVTIEFVPDGNMYILRLLSLDIFCPESNSYEAVNK